METRYQGEDIDLDIKLWDDDTKATPISIDALENLLVYVYTQGNYTAKFSKVAKDGFATMVKIDANTYRCSITSAMSKRLLPGQSIIEIQPIKAGGASDGKDNKIGVVRGFVVLPAKISEQA